MAQLAVRIGEENTVHFDEGNMSEQRRSLSHLAFRCFYRKLRCVEVIIRLERDG